MNRDELERKLDDVAVLATMGEIHARRCEIHPDPSGYSFPCDCAVPEDILSLIAAVREYIRST